MPISRASCALAICFAAAVSAVSPATAEIVIYVSAAGNDGNSGTQLNQSVLTLSRAQEAARELVQGKADDVSVRIAPGTYRAQKVVWSLVVPGRKIEIAGDRKHPENVVFDGDMAGGNFFTVAVSNGSNTGLTIAGITVTRYVMGITLNGNRASESRHNAGTRIMYNRFVANGGYVTDPPTRSVAVVRLVNSKRNVIAHNIFDDMKAPECVFLHAIYLANYSNENEIHDNEFRNGCGDPIRVRDASNYNRIHSNTFENAGARAVAYSEWFCSRQVSKSCTKDGEECPSIGNQFHSNRVGRGYAGASLPAVFVFERPTHPSCSVGPPVSVTGNTVSGVR